MREVVVISTGKTSLTAAFAHLAENKVACTWMWTPRICIFCSIRP